MHRDLIETLDDLHQQLAHIQDLDEEEVRRLRESVEEIQQSLDQSDVSSAGLAKRLQEASDRFQQSHPVLTQTVGRVADMLAQMGI
ncbi:MAG: DUF4404 family protein [Pirellulales bacterium]|nr:DUF4404 family protein [Pirellulales bacterium]